MENRDILFEKIDAKQQEWDEQVKYLRSRASGFDSEIRVRIEEQIDILSQKLKEIEKRTVELKKVSEATQQDIGENVIHSWIEVFTKIDNEMLRLKK